MYTTIEIGSDPDTNSWFLDDPFRTAWTEEKEWAHLVGAPVANVPKMEITPSVSRRQRPPTRRQGNGDRERYAVGRNQISTKLIYPIFCWSTSTGKTSTSTTQQNSQLIYPIRCWSNDSYVKVTWAAQSLRPITATGPAESFQLPMPLERGRRRLLVEPSVVTIPSWRAAPLPSRHGEPRRCHPLTESYAVAIPSPRAHRGRSHAERHAVPRRASSPSWTLPACSVSPRRRCATFDPVQSLSSASCRHDWCPRNLFNF